MTSSSYDKKATDPETAKAATAENGDRKGTGMPKGNRGERISGEALKKAESLKAQAGLRHLRISSEASGASPIAAALAGAISIPCGGGMGRRRAPAPCSARLQRPARRGSSRGPVQSVRRLPDGTCLRRRRPASRRIPA